MCSAKEIDMLQVEMFWMNEPLKLVQIQINNWLRENSHVEIKHILQSADGAGDGTSALVSIWYTEE
jgi:hypothetical protein